jgi:ABC-2 type transport system permease protein
MGLTKAYLTGGLIHKFSPALYLFGLTMVYLSSFLSVWIILSKFGTINDWTLGQIVFIYMICLISYGLRCMFFMQFAELGNLVKNGELDRVLVRPVNPLVHIMGSRFEAGGLSHIFAGSFLFVMFYKQFQIDWTLMNIFYFGLAIVSAALVQGAITIIIGTCSFFLVDIGGINALYKSLREFTFYPVTLYNGVVKFALFFVIPLAFASYVPAGPFLNHPEFLYFPKWFWRVLLLSGVVFIGIAYRFWKFGIKYYQSTGN